MKQVLSVCIIVLSWINASGQSSRNIRLLANWHQDSIIANSSEVRYSDCFGFAHQGMEYAVIGSTEGTHVFLITSDNQLIQKGFVAGRFVSTTVQHREYAVYQNYLYAVCDEGVSSLQIIDLQYLPDSLHVAYEDTLQFGRVHNIFIDTVQSKLYSCIHRSTTSTQTIESPLKVFSLTNPLNPVELWSGPADVLEVHDIYVRNGKAILNCGFDGLRVYDFTNTNSPTYLDSHPIYQEQGYNHQGWLTPDGLTYIFADETNGKRVKKCAFDGNSVQIQNYFGTNYLNGSVPHNIKCTNEFAFVAYYNEGLRVFDLRSVLPKEIAHYDTYPEENAFKMNGNWGVFIDLPSKKIIASDRQYGLFLFEFDFQTILNGFPLEEGFQVFPNPVVSNNTLTMIAPEKSKDASWELIDVSGKVIDHGVFGDFDYVEKKINFQSGMYFLRLKYQDKNNEIQFQEQRIIIL